MTLNPASEAALDLILNRRSTIARTMQAPGPTRAQMETILTAGMRVPDHGKLKPWRFIVLEGDERAKLGELISEALVAEGTASESVAEKMKGYALQGPTLVIAISSALAHFKIPAWEQHLSAGAACQNMLMAASAMGLAGQWLTGWAAYSPTVARGLGLAQGEHIAGLLFFGSPAEKLDDRPRPTLDEKVIWGMPSGNGTDRNMQEPGA